MSILIDKLLAETDLSISTQTKNGKWYVAKPIPFYSLKTKFNRIKDALRIINGKSFAVHYKEDEE